MTVDTSYVGRYGTISLMKKDNSDIPVAHYPIDDEEITIGRDPNCSVRLYYDAISKLHCKVTFEDAKAFLTVYGTSGLVADGFPLFPTATGPTTVPLGNNAEIEIHHKRFIFTYPPKDIRAMILATPEPDRNSKGRKSLRMSIIASAMVFTPRPSQDPRENLRTLQSPLKPNYSSPLKPTSKDEPEEDIVLVETNHPNVVQDDEDNLVILESVQARVPLESPRRFVQFTPQSHQYRTPRRDPRNSLHRAVLIRSAQRTVMKIEVQLEEEREEMEVEDVVTELEETNLDDNSPEEGDDDDVMEEDAPAEIHEQLEEGEADEGGAEEDVSRPLGPFMTPQPSAARASSVLSNQSGFSVQGPQRVRVMQPWKVKDIVVPPPPTVGVKKEDLEPKEPISAEERSAIRARRKSAFMTPDPADSQIPGSRRMSTISRPPPAIIPSVPPSSRKPFIKPDPNPVEEEDTDVLLEKVKAKIEDLRRRQSIGLGQPPLERQRSRSPTKPDAEALFWGSDTVTSTRIDQVDDKGDVGMANPHLQDDDEIMDDDETEELEVIRQTTPVKSRSPPRRKPPPKTPKLDGMKGLFANPKAVPSTPAMGGIKQLFSEPVEPQTPAYGGIRDMFKSTVVPAATETPSLEGVGELLDTSVVYSEQQSLSEPTELSIETTATEPEVVVPGKKVAAAVRGRKGTVEAKKLVDEPTLPMTGAAQPLKIGRPKKALKEAVSLPRPARTKKTADETGPSRPAPTSEPARRTQAVAGGVEAEEQPKPPQTTNSGASKVVRRTRRTPDVPSNPPQTRVTRGRTTPTPTEEPETAVAKKPSSSSNSRATPRRGTRNTPVPDGDQPEPAPAPKKSTRGKRVETIKEEEDEPTVPSRTTTQKGTLTEKSQLPTKSRATTVAEKESPTEKENEPSDSGDNSQSQGAPQTRTRRTTTKAPVVKQDAKEQKATAARPTRVTRNKK